MALRHQPHGTQGIISARMELGVELLWLLASESAVQVEPITTHPMGTEGPRAENAGRMIRAKWACVAAVFLLYTPLGSEEGIALQRLLLQLATSLGQSLSWLS